MFLLRQAASADTVSAISLVREILERVEAEIVVLRQWDERKLAYVIKGQKRGTYLLSLFRVSGTQIVNIERDCNLSDEILRVQILRADHMGQIEIDRELEEAQTSDVAAKLKEDEQSSQKAPTEPSVETPEKTTITAAPIIEE
jgi:small subunit ribosomal protein S6